MELFAFQRILSRLNKEKSGEKFGILQEIAYLCKSVIDFSRLPKQERWNQVEPRCAERWHGCGDAEMMSNSTLPLGFLHLNIELTTRGQLFSVKIYIRLLYHHEMGVNWELTGNCVSTGFVKKFLIYKIIGRFVSIFLTQEQWRINVQDRLS